MMLSVGVVRLLGQDGLYLLNDKVDYVD